jgi:mechanosensitive ion channel-like protein
MADFWTNLIWSAVRNTTETLRVVMPSVLAMLIFVALGALLGWIGGALVGGLARAGDLDRRSREWGLTQALARAGVYRAPSQLLRLVVFWGVFVVFATMGIDALAIRGASGTSGLLMHLLPHALSALLILVVGWLAANFLGQAALIAAVNAGLPEARLLARAARWLVLLFTFATALTEIGIGRDMVLVAFGILFGGLVLALALAFGLGGRHLARHVLERGRLREQEPSDRETVSHI